MRASLIATLALCASAVSATSLVFGSRSDCNVDAVVHVQVDGLSRSTWAQLRHAAPSLRQHALDAPFQTTFESQPELCSPHAWERNVALGDDIASSYGAPGLININVHDLRSQEELLLSTLDSIDQVFPQHKVLITPSASSRSLFKRQVDVLGTFASGIWTEPKGGIFSRYQLFSTPVILILGVIFGILAPITLFAVGQLASLEIPDQIGVRKDPITGDKKNQ